MVGLGIRTRETGATATLQGQEKPVIRSLTGGELTLENTVSGVGFNAIDLLYASLTACLVMSARIAARKLGLIERISAYEVQVSGEKTEQEPYRITRFDVQFRITGDLSETETHELAEMAEAMCTVSNTLKANADVTIST
ncbi:OsmC family protein [Pseudochrobactrum kiredjianiae]|uniref:OsmC family protein n=1 Tax=Pseudochrobactrum kiredjianiae TaxID=386305 RepID=A0ABW3V1C1_9HYPH|nr:OsmC family protein [Pseudochrobactrum kiredjianiae]MDM7851819.1 OsmC family protein [Pseudochrobactrum kiredjianiae]